MRTRSKMAASHLRCVLLAIPVLLALCMPAAAMGWEDQEAMMDSALYRNSFVYAPPQNTEIARNAFVKAPLVGYYEHFGFDANFLTWAPKQTFEPGDEATWASCTEADHPEPCPESDIVGYHTVRHGVKYGPITALLWKGAFIGTVCGNFTKGGGTGPVPTIEGVKYEDRNGNGRRDPGEPGLPGWTMKLRYDGKVVASTVTGAGGHYAFRLDADHLPVGEGTYQVEEEQQPGWVASQAPGAVDVPLGAREYKFAGNDFGNYRPAVISGHKFDDSNVDGIWEQPLEAGIPSWAIDLSNGEQRLTGVEGAYSFEVRPGTYTVAEQARSGWRQTAPGGAGTRTYTVTSGEVVEDASFGNVCLGSVGVTPIDDSTGEALPGVQVRLEEVSVPGILRNEPALPRTGTGTSSFGELLPGTYRVTAFLPEGVFTADPDATVVEGRFAIVEEVSVKECSPTLVKLDMFTQSTPGKITGGVKIAVPDGFATSGFELMSRGGQPRGTLEYQDHEAGLDLHTATIEAIDVSGEVAFVWGKADVEGGEQRFRLRLVDAGEPGVEDRFEITLASGYEAGQGETLSGGNVQIHT